MNKVVVYVLILLTYLGLSKSFSPSEFGINYILNDESMSKIIGGAPVSVILTDIHSTGFIIKTYYHKYKIVYSFHSVEELIVRTSYPFNEKHKKHLGMSIFRRSAKDGIEDFTPMPPGTIFIGDRTLGFWKADNSGERYWNFYRTYRNLPAYLGWGKFRPSYAFHQKAEIMMEQGKEFFGLNNEFGLEGSVTKENLPQYFNRSRPKEVNFQQYFLDYFQRNFYSSRGQNE